jgi:hypothetical protein
MRPVFSSRTPACEIVQRPRLLLAIGAAIHERRVVLDARRRGSQAATALPLIATRAPARTATLIRVQASIVLSPATGAAARSGWVVLRTFERSHVPPGATAARRPPFGTRPRISRAILPRNYTLTAVRRAATGGPPAAGSAAGRGLGPDPSARGPAGRAAVFSTTRGRAGRPGRAAVTGSTRAGAGRTGIARGPVALSLLASVPTGTVTAPRGQSRAAQNQDIEQSIDSHEILPESRSRVIVTPPRRSVNRYYLD